MPVEYTWSLFWNRSKSTKMHIHRVWMYGFINQGHGPVITLNRLSIHPFPVNHHQSQSGGQGLLALIQAAVNRFSKIYLFWRCRKMQQHCDKKNGKRNATRCCSFKCPHMLPRKSMMSVISQVLHHKTAACYSAHLTQQIQTTYCKKVWEFPSRIH